MLSVAVVPRILERAMETGNVIGFRRADTEADKQFSFSCIFLRFHLDKTHHFRVSILWLIYWAKSFSFAQKTMRSFASVSHLLTPAMVPFGKSYGCTDCIATVFDANTFSVRI